MSQLSPRAELPFMLPSQAQKHATYNEALTRLDALVQLSLQGFADETPPAVPLAGDIHGLGPDPLGAWAGHAAELAYWDGAAWLFLTPQPGWLAWGAAEQELRVWRNGAWQQAVDALQNMTGLGIGTQSDATNRVSVAAAATLFSHAGAGHQLKINKATAAETASLLFQSNWSGRAEMGLAGEDAFALKISADGAFWHTALRADPSLGQVSLMPALASDQVAFADHGTMTGFVHNDGSVPADSPVSSGHHWGVTMATDGAHGAQLLIHDSTRGFLRTRNGAGYGAWLELLGRNSLVGTVSKSGNLPTGAVMESGANANGNYLRFADGTQICTRKQLASASGAAVTWTYPAAFITSPGATATSRTSAGTCRLAATENISPTSLQVHTFDGAGSSTVSPTVDLIAIGSWI